MRARNTSIDCIGLLVLALGVAEAAACLAARVEGCKLVTMLGTESFYMLLGLLVYVAVDGLLGLRMVSALSLGAALGVFLKVFINLPRPPETEWLVPASGPGFPSGHALMSSLFWGIVAVETRSPLVTLGGALSVTAISASRLVLHVHYPRDIAGGVVFGTAIALAYLLLRRRYNTLGSSAIMVSAAIPLALLALLHSPGYDSAQHVAGIVLGLAAGLAVVSTRTGKQSLAERLTLTQLVVSLAWASLGLAAAIASRGSPASIPGFASFAFLVATSRPLALLVAGARRSLGPKHAPSPRGWK